MPTRQEELLVATRYLKARDPMLRRVIQSVGPCILPRRRNRFGILVRSILSQQISTAAARTILGRLEGLVAPEKITPENLSKITPARLRQAGISRQKASYLKDLAEKTASGQLRFSRFSKMSNEQIVAELVRVRGIGQWTVEMLLIFALGRLDVLPCDDLGVRKAIKRIYGLDELPSRSACEEIAAPWRPYASVASWYCWRSLE